MLGGPASGLEPWTCCRHSIYGQNLLHCVTRRLPRRHPGWRAERNSDLAIGGDPFIGARFVLLV